MNKKVLTKAGGRVAERVGADLLFRAIVSVSVRLVDWLSSLIEVRSDL
jgi:hypothetical protein